nr:hydantoinase/oxoprolinase family protein [Leucobacter chromiireducens]
MHQYETPCPPDRVARLRPLVCCGFRRRDHCGSRGPRKGAHVYRVSVDTGGTFTDVVVRDPDNNVYMSKALTTRDRAYRAIAHALEDIAGQIGVSVASLIRRAAQINYGTTRSTNLVVTGQSARTALLTTAGFPDVLLLREGGKPDPFRRLHYRGAYVPRYLTFEVSERMTSTGEVYLPLDEETVIAALRDCRDAGVEAIAVCLLWSIADPQHEIRIGELIGEHLPDVPFTLSHQVNPSIREYRRASATAIDASLKPAMQQFFADLELDLAAAGFTGTLLISTSYGGGWHADRIAEQPVYSIGSGPSMAPLAAIDVAERNLPGGAAAQTILVTDMGGTTFDLAVVEHGEIARTNDTWLGGKWVGDITGTRSVDIESIGAGGGSVVWVDGGGMMRVGPLSAGSEPGPVCYGRGGSEPTVTDAALVLGYLDSSNFLGGRLTLDRAGAQAALTQIGDRTGLSLEEAARAALHISVDNIVTAIREKTVARGIDARELVVVAGGGASGLTVGLIARELGAAVVILPKAAGALSAYGALGSDIVSEFDAPTFMSTEHPDFSVDNAAVSRVERAAAEFYGTLDARTASSGTTEYYMQARYPMQAWELTISLGDAQALHRLDAAAVEACFHREHERVFGVQEPDEHVEIVSWGARARARMQTGSSPSVFVMSEGESARATRPAYFADVGWRDTPVLDAGELARRGSITGPAIIREDITTIVVYPDQTLAVLPSGDYQLSTESFITRSGAQS